MPTPDRADCFVYTYKEGLLSRVGHDLKLRVTDWAVALDDDALVATFDPASIEVVDAMEGGAPAPGRLSAKDRGQIVDNLRKHVLPPRGGAIRFRAPLPDNLDEQRWQLRGQLTLNGVTRPLGVPVTRTDGHWRARVRLEQRDFDIAPFRALLGALRIKPHVEVEVSVPVEMLG